MRDTIFLSHANPDDNRFTRWLALRLARDGCKVWCDLTGLLGGEDIWRDVERIIRDHTLKFLCVLSRASNQRAGVLQELQTAITVARLEGLADFIIPLRIDDLPHSETNIQLARLFTTPFDEGWAIGYSMLLQKVGRDAVPRNTPSTPGLVARWWRGHRSPTDGVSDVVEEYLSNWFPIKQMPHLIHFHEMTVAPPDGMPSDRVGVWQAPYLISFAPAQDIRTELGDIVRTAPRYTRIYPTTVFLEQGGGGIPQRQARDVVYRLLRLTWERFIESRGLPAYEMANKAMCGYFTSKLVGEERVPFRTADGKGGSRQLVGHRTRSRRGPDGGYEPVRQYWHFGVEARPLVRPRFAYAIHPHVLFSHDGLNIWQNKNALHRARRSACKEWWNDEWRDRILATMSWLASGGQSIVISVGTGICIEVGCDPVRFMSPVSYVEPEERLVMLEDETDDDDDNDGEGAAE